MRISSSLCLSVAVLALAACAGKPHPPAMTFDSENFKPAVAEVEPEVKAPEVAGDVPAPPPMIAPPAPSKPDARPPTARVDAANRAALQEPTSHGYLNAVQIYQYNDGALYRLYTAPEQVSDIALQPGEALVSVSAGDTVRWVVGNTTSGEGPDKRVHILVKPFAPDLHTSIVITTDRRTYHVWADSTANTAMAVMSWTYPQDAITAAKHKFEEAQTTIDDKIDLSNVKFRYAITGDNPPWKPVHVFDDTKKVYIEFPARLDQGEAPPLFVVGPQGNSELVNYRVRGHYYIVDRLFAAAELRLGQKPQQVVRITRNEKSVSAASTEKAGG